MEVRRRPAARALPGALATLDGTELLTLNGMKLRTLACDYLMKHKATVELGGLPVAM